MEDGCAKVGGRGRLGVLWWYVEVKFEYACFEWSMCWSGEEDVDFGQRVGGSACRWEEVVWRERLVVKSSMIGGQAAQCARVL